MGDYLFTSESVTEGHPDKVADQISDAILDGILSKDPKGRVACETLVTTGLAFVSGEITTEAYVEIPRIVRETIREIGYTSPTYGFDHETCAVLSSIDEQSGDIWLGVEGGGAGDQGMMFGYATSETEEYMPMPIHLAHRLARRLAKVRKERILNYLRPDGKTQVTVQYENGKPVAITTVVVSAHHSPDVDMGQMSLDIKEKVVDPVLPHELKHDEYRLLVNPTGRFEVGGPQADCGLTGRKIIVDTYGGVGSHGGGCFSGKDPTKVDRSASYAARHVAKNMVAAGLAERCEIQIAYAIGVPEPISVMIDSKGTGQVPDRELVEIVRKHFDLRPRAIIDRLDLSRPIYRRTASYGHFGREESDFTWERLDMVDDLKEGC
ncbi:MAG: methionine adenosyltransferase [Candidatus Eisenbacteria bacterium]|nr:methionine adenosyltransferase [Candidatus Eisenbacteria bacterium]